MKLRARLDIREPLKKEKKVKKPRGDWLLAKFRYERLPNFCFICGRIGHIDRHCEIYFRIPDDKIIRNWDITMRAPPLQYSTLGGEKWLVEEVPEGVDNNTVLQAIEANTQRKFRYQTSGLLANLGASKNTQSLPLKEFYELPKHDDSPIVLTDDRKRPRSFGAAQHGAENMEVEQSIQVVAGKFTHGIQVPLNLAGAGLQGGSSCQKQ
ncbi:hypothetical protein LINPERHAP1_LOCUS26106 [Linum perenne]